MTDVIVKPLSDVGVVAVSEPVVVPARGASIRSRHQHRFQTMIHRGAQKALIVVTMLAAIVGIWAAVVAIFNMPRVELPSPALVWNQFHLYFGVLMSNAKPTVIEGTVGYLIAVLLGVPIGYVLSRPGKIGAAMQTAVLSAQIFPKIAVAPLLIVWFGFGFLPKFLFVFLLAFFPIAINAAAGFSSVPLEINDLGHMIGMSAFGRLRHLQGPSALPQIFTGLKISSSFAIIAALVFEFVGAQRGLGVLVVQTEANLNTAFMFAALIVVALLGFLFYGVIVCIEVLAIPWHVSQRRTH